MEDERSIYRFLGVEPRNANQIPLGEVTQRAEVIGYKLTGPNGDFDPGAVDAMRRAIAFSDRMAQDQKWNALVAAARASMN